MGYIFLLIYIIIVYILVGNSEASRKKEVILFCVGIFIFVGLRDQSVGTDTMNYCLSYERVVHQNLINPCAGMNISQIANEVLFGSGEEIGYHYFVFLLSRFFDDAQALLIAEGLIISICYGIFMYQQSDDIFISTLILMSFGLLSFFLSGIRQSIAMAFCVISYLYLINKKHIKFVIWLIIAITFHRSAWIFGVLIICIAISETKILNKFRWRFIPSVIVGVVICTIVPTLLRIVSGTSGKWEQFSEVESTNNGYVFFAIVLVVGIVIEVFRNDMESKSPELQIQIKAFYLYFILWMTRLVTRTTERVCLFLTPSVMVLFPRALNEWAIKQNDRTIKLIAVLFIIAFYIFRYWNANYALCF